jgi:hypothetical protein
MFVSQYIYVLFAMLTAGVIHPYPYYPEILLTRLQVQAHTEFSEGYGIEDFTWEVETCPGGPKTKIIGPIENVVSYLNAVNPNWKVDFNVSGSPQKSDLLQKRQIPWPFTGLLCGIRISEWGYASWEAIGDGIKYLDRVPGTPTNRPGPGNCGRVSCSYESAIWWCNDVCLV